jgi:hypothetical protein
LPQVPDTTKQYSYKNQLFGFKTGLYYVKSHGIGPGRTPGEFSVEPAIGSALDFLR